jgi:hypothetical protein
LFSSIILLLFFVKCWDPREMESAQGKRVREGQGPQARREISSQPPASKEAAWSRR